MGDVRDVIVYYKLKMKDETDEGKMLRILKKLAPLPITVDLFQATGIGKAVSALRKWDGEVGQRARDLVADWKRAVANDVARPKSRTNEVEDCNVSSTTNGGSASDGGKRRNKEDNQKSTPTLHTDRRPHKSNRSSSSSADMSTSKQSTKKGGKRLVDAGGDGFTATMASFEDCLGLNDVRRAAKKTKKLVKEVSLPRLPPLLSDSPQKSLDVGSTATSSRSVSPMAPCTSRISAQQPNTDHVDILSSLPAIQTDYKPLRFVAIDDPPPTKRKAFDVDDTNFMSSRNSRTQVFSGRRAHFLTEVPTLLTSCIKVLQENVNVLSDLQYAPYEHLKSVLLRCTPERLLFLEEMNPYLLEESDELWKVHCQREFKSSKREEFETWRELYYRMSVYRDKKLKSITANISASMAKAVPVRQTKLAYVDCAAKPPRSVARQQARFGTAGKSATKEPIVKLGRPGSSASGSMDFTVAATSETLPSNGPLPPLQQKVVKKVAPLMQKTLKFMKNRFRR